MPKKIKAIVIDPVMCMITETTIDGSLESLQHAIGDRRIEVVYLDHPNVMYVDEEGLFLPNQSYFVYNDETPLAGKAVIVGVGEDGQTIGTSLNVTDLLSKIAFHSASEIVAMNLQG